MADYRALFTGQPAAAVAAEPPSRYRLLLVDDEPGVRNALARSFRQENYEVAAAADGEEALALLRQSPVHVVISDYMMPGMNGADLLKRIKQEFPDTIRIMLTGHADTSAVMGAINEGAVYKFILKPWNDDDLRVTVALALEQYELKRRNQALTADNDRKSREIKALSQLAATNRSQLGFVLHKKGLLTGPQLQELVHMQQTRREPVIRLLLERGWVEEKKIRELLRKDLLIEEVSLPEFQVDPAVAALLPAAFCQRQWVVPLKIEKNRLLLAMADPLDEGLIDDLRFTGGLSITAVAAEVKAIEAKLAELHGEAGRLDFRDLATVAELEDPFDSVQVVIEDDDAVSLDDLLRSTEAPPAIRLANAIILEAIRLGASDIHIQPRTKHVAVRLRIDGVLHDKIHFPNQMLQSLVSRLKIMSELDISERRRPQDGRLTVKTPFKVVDLRLSTLPTINGEKVVMRILDRNSAVLDLAALGFSPPDLRCIEAMVARPQGIILATGPTGSGKTTTLYSLLQHGVTPEKNYITIEDPVEYTMDMAGQVYVRERIGLTFPLVLRSILRQDPDIILIGEIRDAETAEVAFHAAMTGHQVFSTLHTNSAMATVARLLDLGLKPFVVTSALEGIIAQRLARRVCADCAEEVSADPLLLSRLGPIFSGISTIRRGRGCSRCAQTGYQGRIGLYEVLSVDDRLRECIARGAGLVDMERTARDQGMRTLADDAAEKLRSGLTTPEEILRVLGPCKS